MIIDKGYDAKANSDTARSRGICPIISHRSNARANPSASHRLKSPTRRNCI